MKVDIYVGMKKTFNLEKLILYYVRKWKTSKLNPKPIISIFWQKAVSIIEKVEDL